MLIQFIDEINIMCTVSTKIISVLTRATQISTKNIISKVYVDMVKIHEIFNYYINNLLYIS